MYELIINTMLLKRKKKIFLFCISKHLDYDLIKGQGSTNAYNFYFNFLFYFNFKFIIRVIIPFNELVSFCIIFSYINKLTIFNFFSHPSFSFLQNKIARRLNVHQNSITV